jgi:hypothetical protein
VATAETTQQIHDLFALSCIELFEGLNCMIVSTELAPGVLDHAPLAMIDAGSDDLELSLFIRAPFTVLGLTYPCRDGITEIEDSELEDWLAELANQLVGKLKNRLLHLGCTLKLGLPNSYFDAEYADAVIPDTGLVSSHFAVDHEPVECSLYLEIFNPDMKLHTQSVVDDSDSGELELF